MSESSTEQLQELRVLTSTLNAFMTYPSAAIRNVVTPKRFKYNGLENHYKAMVPFFEQHLHRLQTCIEENAFFLESVANAASIDFDSPPQNDWSPCSGADVDKVHSTLRQLAREWSSEGALERDQTYGKVVRELLDLYPDEIERHNIKVLVPGCGLGRLPFDLAAQGFQAQGNEFSFHMLFTSSYMLNHTISANMFRIHPFIHATSHQRSRDSQLREILIPDVFPAEALNGVDLLSMNAGSFDEVYPKSGTFNAVTTVFFIDTAPNIFRTLKAISDTLTSGGYWINIGPLLWHYEDTLSSQETQYSGSDGEVDDRSGGLELTLIDLLNLLPEFGFDIVKRESGVKCGYTRDSQAMGGFVYECEYWVAVKR